MLTSFNATLDQKVWRHPYEPVDYCYVLEEEGKADEAPFNWSAR